MQPPITPRPESAPDSSRAQDAGTDTRTASDNVGAGAPSLSVPKGGGAIRGIGEKFATNPANGTCSMTIPVPVSPARSGFAPQLSLGYDSGSGNGPFGLGWNLSVPSITRKTDKGLPRYDDDQESDVYLLSNSEDLVPEFKKDRQGNWIRDTDGNFVFSEVVRVVDGEAYQIRDYRPRTEGLFSRIERWTRASDGDIHWRSLSSENVTTFYGQRQDEAPGAPIASRVADPRFPDRVFSWLICKSYDAKGSAIAFVYVPEDSTDVDLGQANECNRTDLDRVANRYLKRIFYGNITSLLAGGATVSPLGPDLSAMGWHFEVVLDYGEGHVSSPPTVTPLGETIQASLAGTQTWPVREDAFSRARSCFEVRTYRRCDRILTFHHFKDELPDPDTLVCSLDLSYDATPFVSYVSSVTQSGYSRQDDGSYLRKSLPRVEFTYSRSPLESFSPDAFAMQDLDPSSLENVPAGTADPHYQWVDLDGEGIAGLFIDDGAAWYYKPNLGEGLLDGLQVIKTRPVTASVTVGEAQLLDLASDGQLDVVHLGSGARGFFERSEDHDWEPFRAFLEIPDLDWHDPNLRFVDLTGDGLADILITRDHEIAWHPSAGEDGFESAILLRNATDEKQGPRLIFADARRSVFLADMTGDGLSDLVRIRQGEVCYWPNLGYGRFGRRVTMNDAPWFDRVDQFDQRRIHLADTDGSGPADIIYHGPSGADIYLNQSGNGWSEAKTLTAVPAANPLTTITTADLLGRGTICLAWSSSLPGDTFHSMRYMDLMNGQKPNLLVGTRNNLGAETVIGYASSTEFFLRDKEAGTPWITRLPFPVHVVERIETHDRISLNRFVSRFAYHHGFFDGVEREFRGFGMVEQWDTEELASLKDSDAFPSGNNIDAASYVPPVLTRSWFQTGVYLGRDRVSNYFAGLGNGKGEYYREPRALNDDILTAKLLLDDTVIPEGLSVDEEREACRSLRGFLLRREVYAIDGKNVDVDYPFGHPYVVTEQNFTIEFVQPTGGNRHAIFFTHPREVITNQYERAPDDPRISHELTLEVDSFGNVLKTATIGYSRRVADTSLSSEDQEKQQTTLITYAENAVSNAVDQDDAYHSPLPVEGRSYELTGYQVAAGGERFVFADFVREGATGLELIFDTEIPYEVAPTTGKQRRLVEQTRTLFRHDDLSGALPLGLLQPLAIRFESYKLAFTTGLVGAVFSGKVTDSMLTTEGHYVHSDGDVNWWIPSGKMFFSPGPNDTPAQELESALQHFFIPRRFRDPFHTDAIPTETTVRYDPYDLLVVETIDALGNRTTAGVRADDPTLPLVQTGLDYRVLQPVLLMDPNRNRTSMAFDTLGMLVGTAMMGKPGQLSTINPATELGDNLVGFAADLPDSVVAAQLGNPIADPLSILKNATSRLVNDLFAYVRSANLPAPQPAVVYTLLRETHASEVTAGTSTNVQYRFAYSDGFGREIQRKVMAEPGPTPQRDPTTGKIVIVNGQPQMTTTDTNPRWVGNGWTVFNNKGKPVRRYEPFFTDTHRFEFDVRIGVSSTLFYDPVDRVVATLHPNHSWEKVVFTPWDRQSWDVNDTVQLVDPQTNLPVTDPKRDPDVAEFFERLPDADYLPTWYDQRILGALGPREQSAAMKAVIHAGTPRVAHLDVLGRTFHLLLNNRFQRSTEAGVTEETHRSWVGFDIEGNQRQIFDERRKPDGTLERRLVMRYDYDVVGTRIHQSSMEAGERWMLNDVASKPLYSWDSRAHQFRATYDRLRRPVGTFLREGIAAEVNIGVTSYGESLPFPETYNLRGKPFQVFDQAGVSTTDVCDFKGNLLHATRSLATDYKDVLNWAASVPLEIDVFATMTEFDALNRPVKSTSPDGSVVRHAFNVANLLERIDVNLQGAAAATGFVTNIDYDAKGQRTRIDYGNKASTTYEYDPDTFRLTRLVTRRSATAFPADGASPPPVGWPGQFAQNLSYTYDPIGNVTSIRDDAQQVIYFSNIRVEPSAEYAYDAVYRLIEAAGREHLASAGGDPVAPNASETFHTGLGHPGDGNLMGTYLEQYSYDFVGNFLEMKHRGSNAAQPGWTRSYSYNEASLIDPSVMSNRLSQTKINGVTEPYAHDAHGNVTSMPHLSRMDWDFHDQLNVTSRQITNDTPPPATIPETTYYVYDSGGQRARKVSEIQGGRRKYERIYLGGFEIYREFEADGTTVELERQTLNIQDDTGRIAIVETKTISPSRDPSPNVLIRYQFGNHLGSVSLELDDLAQVITYEEYAPYGSTTYQAVRTGLDTNPKRYRFTGKERDEENGFSYHGARYYAPWLGRWTACDPAGASNGISAYVYTNNNPIALHDPTGNEPEKSWLQKGADIAKGFVTAHGETEVNRIKSTLVSSIPIYGDMKRSDNYAATGKEIALRYKVYTAGALGESGPSAAVHALNEVLNPLAHAKQASDRADRSERAGDYVGVGKEKYNELKSLVEFGQIVIGVASAAGAATKVGPVGAGEIAAPEPPKLMNEPIPSAPRPSFPRPSQAAAPSPPKSAAPPPAKPPAVGTVPRSTPGVPRDATHPGSMFHYTDVPPENFAKGLRRGTSFTSEGDLSTKQAVSRLGLRTAPTHVVEVIEKGQFRLTGQKIVQPHPLGQGGAYDYFAPHAIPPEDIINIHPMQRGGPVRDH